MHKRPKEVQHVRFEPAVQGTILTRKPATRGVSGPIGSEGSKGPAVIAGDDIFISSCLIVSTIILLSASAATASGEHDRPRP